MTLSDLIEQLQDLLEEFPALGDRDVMIAQQPSYPLTAVIDCVSLVDSEDADEDYDEDAEDAEEYAQFLAETLPLLLFESTRLQ